jgi:DNA topoisomerase-1
VSPQDEHIEAAQLAGLRYVSDSQPGIRRQRSGSGFRYLDHEGKPIKDPALVTRIRGLVIPPAWTEVWICPTPDGHIQATARDAAGRKQYRYHPRYRAIRDETKFDRMFEFSEVLPRIREQVEKDLALTGHPRAKILATVVRLLEKTLIRVGNAEYARENRSFGLTTLRRRHVDVSGDTMAFEFRGKSGVVHQVRISDRRLARIVQHCQTLPGEELFKYLDDAYLREIAGHEITAKDFRTWAGTMHAAAALRDLGPTEAEREAKRNVVQAIDQVAERLGNTRAVCRKYYVHPVVIEAYLRGIVPPIPPKPKDPKRERPGAAIRREEAAVLEFIQQQSQTRQ